MNSVIERVKGRIQNNSASWHDVFWILLRLTLDDRLACGVSPSSPKMAQGIWGKSFVRTYYDWIGTQASEPTKLEGGIATTYYVFHSLSALVRRLNVSLPAAIERDMLTFFTDRTKSDGIGVYTIDNRGECVKTVYFRHTCFGMMIINDLCTLMPDSHSREWAGLARQATNIVTKDVDWRELREKWFKESWPVGGMASYVAARTRCLAGENAANSSWKVVWPQVEKEMVSTIGGLTSGQIESMRRTLTSGSDQSPCPEYYPHWEPIKGKPVLRLHSTLGCLHLIGKEIASCTSGRRRLEELINLVSKELLGGSQGLPRFAPTEPPSVAAACALLCFVLGPWFEDWFKPSEAVTELVDRIMDFLETRMLEPSIYGDFWSEFCAPLLAEPWLFDALRLQEMIRETPGSDLQTFCDSFPYASTSARDAYKNIASVAFA